MGVFFISPFNSVHISLYVCHNRNLPPIMMGVFLYHTLILYIYIYVCHITNKLNTVKEMTTAVLCCIDITIYCLLLHCIWHWLHCLWTEHDISHYSKLWKFFIILGNARDPNKCPFSNKRTNKLTRANKCLYKKRKENSLVPEQWNFLCTCFNNSFIRNTEPGDCWRQQKCCRISIVNRYPQKGTEKLPWPSPQEICSLSNFNASEWKKEEKKRKEKKGKKLNTTKPQI